MHHKNILLVSATTRLHERMRELSHVIDVSIALANAASFSQAAASGHTFDLIILDQKDLSQDVISTVENYSAQMVELLACLLLTLIIFLSLFCLFRARAILFCLLQLSRSLALGARCFCGQVPRVLLEIWLLLTT